MLCRDSAEEILQMEEDFDELHQRELEDEYKLISEEEKLGCLGFYFIDFQAHMES